MYIHISMYDRNAGGALPDFPFQNGYLEKDSGINFAWQKKDRNEREVITYICSRSLESQKTSV